ncbi:MAG: nucleoside-diphosphate kinase [Candidatus Micrarchaeota archaeon]|nr:nucleoside-diphosphate kinase [Candidatus Micrarchaeota archaeon]
MERTLVLIKPDGVQRALIGKVISTFEDCGLKISGLKMVKANRELAAKHYAEDKTWMETLGKKAIASYEASGAKVTETPMEIGTRIRNGLMGYLTESPIVCMVVEGNEAIGIVLKHIGATTSHKADPSTIRGKYSSDSYGLADKTKRPVRNVVHASDSKESAEREIGVWFTEKEIFEYKRADEAAMY